VGTTYLLGMVLVFLLGLHSKRLLDRVYCLVLDTFTKETVSHDGPAVKQWLVKTPWTHVVDRQSK
jgi:hypothetical protein